jgi:hypothetical protein
MLAIRCVHKLAPPNRPQALWLAAKADLGQAFFAGLQQAGGSLELPGKEG